METTEWRQELVKSTANGLREQANDSWQLGQRDGEGKRAHIAALALADDIESIEAQKERVKTLELALEQALADCRTLAVAYYQCGEVFDLFQTNLVPAGLVPAGLVPAGLPKSVIERIQAIAANEPPNDDEEVRAIVRAFAKPEDTRR